MQKLADKINEQFAGVWHAKLIQRWLIIRRPGQKDSLAYDAKASDDFNARFIVWGLERLEEMGFAVQFNTYAPYDLKSLEKWGKSFYICMHKGEKTGEVVEIGYGDTAECLKTINVNGKTRAQAVYNALCKALEVEP